MLPQQVMTLHLQQVGVSFDAHKVFRHFTIQAFYHKSQLNLRSKIVRGSAVIIVLLTQAYDFLVFELCCPLEINILFGSDIKVALWPEARIE